MRAMTDGDSPRSSSSTARRRRRSSSAAVPRGLAILNYTDAHYNGQGLPTRESVMPSARASIPERSPTAFRATVLLIAPLPTVIRFFGCLKVPLAVQALLQVLLPQDFLCEH